MDTCADLLAEVERLRAVLAAIDAHSVKTLREKCQEIGEWADDLAFIGKLARGH